MKCEENEGKEVNEGWQGGLEVDWLDLRGDMSLDEKLDMTWFALRAEFSGLKKEQFKCAFDRSIEGLKCKELGTCDLRRAACFRF